MTGWDEKLWLGVSSTPFTVPGLQLLLHIPYGTIAELVLTWLYLAGVSVCRQQYSDECLIGVSRCWHQPMNGWKMNDLLVSAAPISHLNEWEFTLSHRVMGPCADNTGSMSSESKHSIQHRWSLLCLQPNHSLHSLFCVFYIYSFYP